MEIEFTNVSYSYEQLGRKGRAVLQNVSFRIEEGDFAAIIGPSGAGKTTLLQHVTGLLRPSAGKVYVDGEDIWAKNYRRDILRRQVGLVFQFPEKQLFEDTVFDDVAFGPRNLQVSEQDVEKRVREAIELVGLKYEEIKDRSPHNLSGGEKRRVAIAGILAMAPQAIVLDEPTAGLDPAGCKRILEILKLLNDQGVTVIMITHHLDLAIEVAKRFLILVDGKIVFDGNKENLIDYLEKFPTAKIKIPQVVKLSRFLHANNILPDWRIYSVIGLKNKLKELRNIAE